MVVDGKAGPPYDGIVDIVVSPDSTRVAYGAGVGHKQFVVVDGIEQRQYDGVANGTLVFSPDSKRVVYSAQIRHKWTLVIDDQSGTPYDTIVNLGGGRIIFDSSVDLHYLAVVRSDVYLVEERIV